MMGMLRARPSGVQHAISGAVRRPPLSRGPPARLLERDAPHRSDSMVSRPSGDVLVRGEPYVGVRTGVANDFF